MRTLPPPLPRRLPGVGFEVPPPALDETLPRMDIAFFAGFAARGPLDRAMAVESLAGFEALYGTGITLARELRTGAAVRGLLHPCVRSFFSQGGRRCWILRVAGRDAETAAFAVPGMLQADGAEDRWRVRPATLRAASAGSGADALRVAARTAGRLLRAQPVFWRDGLLVLATAASDVLPGDLLRIDLDGVRVHGRVASVVQDASDCVLSVGPFCGLRRASTWVAPQLAGIDDAAQATSPPAVRGTWHGDGMLRVRWRRAAPWPQPGEVRTLRFADADDGWMAVDAVDLLSPVGTDGEAEIELRGTPWFRAETQGVLQAWQSAGDPKRIELLRLDLQVREPGAQPQFATALAPAARAGEHALGLSDPLRFPLVAGMVAPGATQLWLPIADPAGSDAELAALPSPRTPLERDGLARFGWELFAEPMLQDLPADVLADQAQALRLAGANPRPLRGVHALLGGTPPALADEPTLFAIPDAVHAGWDRTESAAAWALLPALPEPPDPCGGEPFRDCDAEPLPAPQPVRGADPDAAGNFTLHWTTVAPEALYTLEEAADAAFTAASVVFEGDATRFAVLGKRPGATFYRVRATLGRRRSGWSDRVQVTVGMLDYATREWDSGTLLELHGLMLRCAAARGDLLAVLGLPEHFDTAAAQAHAHQLRTRVRDSRTLSHGALYHPWMVIRRVDEVLHFPPDGAACGQQAASALRRGAWIAVANAPLRDVVALTPPGMAPLPQQRQQLLDAQVNLVRSAPHGFVFSSADTLTPDSAWRPVNVRRLMCLLRRLALRRGATYVFEPNGPALRRTVERGFGALLDDLFRRGALAGAQADDAYRVEAGDDVNKPRRRDAGQFWVQLKVAPALPLSFLTVRLAREGERVVSRELH